MSFLEKHAGINKFQIELENSYDYPYSKYKKKITCMALFGRFPRPAIKGSCLDFEKLNSLSLITEHLPVQSCHLMFETVGLVAVPLFVFISTKERSSNLLWSAGS